MSASNKNGHSNGVNGKKRSKRDSKGALPAPYEQRLQKIDEDRASLYTSLDGVIRQIDQELNQTAIPIYVDEDDEDSLVVRLGEAIRGR